MSEHNQRTRISEHYRPQWHPEEIRKKFPLLEPKATLEAFIHYHLEKGTQSFNWDSTFHGWCDYRQRQAQAALGTERQTDSMGFPLNRAPRAEAGEGNSGAVFLAQMEVLLNEGHSWNDARQIVEERMSENQ